MFYNALHNKVNFRILVDISLMYASSGSQLCVDGVVVANIGLNMPII